jgi:hypothetical protein
MATYRAYTLDIAGKITWGEWIEAADLDEARRKAHALCDDAHPTVELWQGATIVTQVACPDGKAPEEAPARRRSR